MNHPSYTLITKYDNLSVFYFTREGKKGHIKKVIAFTATTQPNIVNLAMGDVLPDGKLVDDLVVTNKNGWVPVAHLRHCIVLAVWLFEQEISKR